MQSRSESDFYTIVVFGVTGVGKSSLANEICGEKDLFKVGHHLISETTKFSLQCRQLNGGKRLPIKIIDSPGLRDSSGVLNSEIYGKFQSFLIQHHIQLNCVLFCIKETPRLSANDLDDLKTFIEIIGRDHIKNIYVTITQLDALEEKEFRPKRIQLIKNELPAQLQEKIPGFIPSNILMPEKKNFGVFIDYLTKILFSSQRIDFKRDEYDFSKPLQIKERINAFLTMKYKEAYDKLRNLSEEECKNNLQKRQEKDSFEEQMFLIDIVRREKYPTLSAIILCLRASSSKFFSELNYYFTSDEDQGTLRGDIKKIFKGFSAKDSECRLDRKKFAKDLIGELQKCLKPCIHESFTRILKKAQKTKNQGFFRQSNSRFEFNEENKEEPRSFSKRSMTEAQDLYHAFVSEDSGSPSTKFVTGVASLLSTEKFKGIFSGKTSEKTVETVSAIATGTKEVASKAAEGRALGESIPSIAYGATLILAIGAAFFLYKEVGWSREAVIQKLSLNISNEILRSHNDPCAQQIKLLLEFICFEYLWSSLHLN